MKIIDKEIIEYLKNLFLWSYSHESDVIIKRNMRHILDLLNINELKFRSITSYLF